MKTDVIIFDFDGVILESVGLKGSAFAELYKDHGPDIQKKVLDYHLEYGGVSRFVKIRHYEENFLGRSVTDVDVESIAQRFSAIVEDKVAKCSWVEGAEEFLKNNYKTIPLFVASATPTEELRRIVDSRGMNQYFKGVYGSPGSKGENIKAILQNGNFKNAVMIGDTISDYKGAQENSIRFIGRVARGDKNPFPDEIAVLENLERLQDHVN